MPKSAIPQHVLDRDWEGTDNDSWLMRLKKKVQYVFAAGPNVPGGFWKWREIPLLLFYASPKWTRIENTDGSWTGKASIPPGFGNIEMITNTGKTVESVYVSRIQPWCRWHISLQWPLFFNCHVIYRSKNVVKYPKYQSEFGITKMFTFGIGFKRDGDKVYWLTSNLGGNFE